MGTMVEPSSLSVKVNLGLIHKTFTTTTGVTRSLPTCKDNDGFALMLSYLSCLRLNPKCTLTYWEHPDYKGAGQRVQNLGGGVHLKNGIGATWNDRISSLQCTCLPTATFPGTISSLLHPSLCLLLTFTYVLNLLYQYQ